MTKSKWVKASFGFVFLASLSSNLLGANPGDVIVTEIMQNPSAVSDGSGEFFEVYNTTASTINLDGWVIKDKDSDSHTIDNGGTLNINAGEYIVLSINSDSSTNGGVTAAYEYSGMFLANGSDEVMLVENGVTIDSVAYDNGSTFPDPNGKSMELLDVNSDNNVGANWAEALSAWTGSAGDFGSPGTQNTVANADFPPTASNVNRTPQVPSSSDLVTISAELTDDGSLTTASSTKQLFYDTGSGFTSTNMINSSGDTFEGVIPPQADGTIVNYYVSVTDIGGQTVTSPSDAPVSFYSYQVNNSGTTPALVINEILYNDGGNFEFIEIFNNTGSAVDLSSWMISDGGNTFTIPNGSSVNNNDFIILTQDLANFATTYPAVTNVVGEYLFGLSSGGESVILMDVNGSMSDQVDFENGTNSWPATTTGFSIELINPASDNNVGLNWQVSNNSGGNPGQATASDVTAPDLISASASTSTTIDLQFDENLDQTTAETPGNYSVNNGITVSTAILDGGNNSIVHLTVSVLTSGQPYQVTVINVEDNLGNAITSDSESFTFTTPSSPGDVIITEIMQNPTAVSDNDGEFFEIYNTTGSTIDLDGWVIKDKDSESHTIDNGGPLNINSGEYLVLGRNLDTATNGGVNVAYQYSSFFLGNSSDEVILEDNGVTIDSVAYDNGSTFPDPSGASMELTDILLDNNVGTNWLTATSAWIGSAGDFGTPGASFGGTNSAPDPVAISVTVSGNDIILTWSASTGATAYDVYRRTSPDFGTPPSPTELVAGDVAGVSYVDSGAAGAGTTFYYVVVAKN